MKNDNSATTSVVSNKAKITKAFFYAIVGGTDISGTQNLSVNISLDATADDIADVRDAINALMQDNEGSSVATAYELQKILMEGAN